MIEQFNFDIRLIFAILNGKVSAAINRKLSRNFRQNGLEITPEQWTVLIFHSLLKYGFFAKIISLVKELCFSL